MCQLSQRCCCLISSSINYITQFGDQVRIILISQLTLCVSRVLQKCLKYFISLVLNLLCLLVVYVARASSFIFYTFLYFSILNHHGAEISVIWLAERSAITLLILVCYQGKTNFEVQRNFNANATLVALFTIRFRSLFFDIKTRRQCSQVTAILCDLS